MAWRLVKYPSGSVDGSGGGGKCATGFAENEGLLGESIIVDADDCELYPGESFGVGGFEEFFLVKRPISRNVYLINGLELIKESEL
jgi:hypothetical protein